MYKTFLNQLRLECARWKAHNGKRIRLVPSNLLDILRTRHLVRHYTACMAVVDMLDARDPYTAEHTRRVAIMCQRIAIIMRLPSTQIVRAIIAGGGHDIGKVGVPDRILLKEGALDSQEFEILKHHSSIGANILLKISDFEEIAAAVWHHHERWMERAILTARPRLIFR